MSRTLHIVSSLAVMLENACLDDLGGLRRCFDRVFSQVCLGEKVTKFPVCHDRYLVISKKGICIYNWFIVA